MPTGGGLERRSPGRGSHLLAYSEALINVLHSGNSKRQRKEVLLCVSLIRFKNAKGKCKFCEDFTANNSGLQMAGTFF